jgi:arylsulfatase A-like enzyme
MKQMILCLAVALSGCLPAAQAKPNILLILADDMGYGDAGFNGCSDIPTPHIDSIAANGVRFTSGYVTGAQCAPSRAGLLAGIFQSRFGREENFIIAENGIPQDVRLFGSYMKDAGYRTGMVGKWHLGHDPENHPLERGFDWFYGFLGGASFYYPKPNQKTIPDILENRIPQTVTRYLTDVFGDAAIRFIEDESKKPFFLYLSFNAPHEPMEAPEEYLKRFEHLASPDDEPMPNRGTMIAHPRQVYAAMVANMDDNIGRVLEALRSSGAEKNTLVVFLSDNGGPSFQNASSNKPLRGMKGYLLEGGVRVPFAMQWKNTVASGQIVDTVVSSLDLLPTSLAAADADIPGRLEGISLLSLLTDGKEPEPRVLRWRWPFPAWQSNTWWSVRQGDWKLINEAPRRPRGGFTGDPGTVRLYNLAEDISETKDLSAEYPEIRQKLQAEYDRWNSTLPPEQWTESR